jgi:bleomycin resistance family protein
MAQAAAKKRKQEPEAAKQSFHGSFCWHELMTRDIDGAKRFYRDTIGWTFEPMKMNWGTYWLAKSGDKNVGGMFELKGPDFDGVPIAGCPISPSMTSMPASSRRSRPAARS